jgi:hypothetical protein
MSRVRYFFYFLLFNLTQSFAQDFFEEKVLKEFGFKEKNYFEYSAGLCGTLLNLSYGSMQGPGRPAMPPISITGEYRLSRNFSLGAGLHYEELRIRQVQQGGPAPGKIPVEKSNRINAGIRLAWFLSDFIFPNDKINKNDIYVGIRLGGTLIFPELSAAAKKGLYPLDYLANPSRVTGQLFFGYSRFFNQNWGVYSELAAGSPYFFVGGIKYRK